MMKYIAATKLVINIKVNNEEIREGKHLCIKK